MPRGDSSSSRSKCTTTCPKHSSRGPSSAPAQQRAHPHQELVELERLGEIVVRALLETAYHVGRVVLGGEDQDRHVVARGARAARDLEARLPGQHHVQDHQVEWGRDLHALGCATSICQHLHLVALRLEVVGQAFGEMRLVFDDQHARHA
jgi:hypothetical protein